MKQGPDYTLLNLKFLKLPLPGLPPLPSPPVVLSSLYKDKEIHVPA